MGAIVRLNTLYRHANNNTVAFEILKRFYVPETGVWKLKVAWWVVSSRRVPAPMLITQKIEIPTSRVAEWRPMDWNERGPAPQLQVL